MPAHLVSLMKVLFRLNSKWFWLEYKTQWAVYFKGKIYFLYVILKTVKGKEIISFKVESRSLVCSRIVLQDVKWSVDL